MRPNFPHEFTEKQKTAMSPYAPSLRRISHLVDWLRYDLLHEDREEFREHSSNCVIISTRWKPDLLTKVEARFVNETESPGAKSRRWRFVRIHGETRTHFACYLIPRNIALKKLMPNALVQIERSSPRRPVDVCARVFNGIAGQGLARDSFMDYPL